jgi:hypothetical protein
MSHRRSSTAEAVTQTPIRIGAERLARRCAIEHAPWLIEHAPWLAGSKAVVASALDNPPSRVQRLTIIIQPAPATVPHMAILASDQAAQLQSP